MVNSKQTNALQVLRILKQRYAGHGFGTNMGNPFHTLVATLLSAQTTDKQVLKIYPAFQKRFPDAEALSTASVAEISEYIRTVGLYKTKAKHLQGLGLALRGRDVPMTMQGLTALPGVGRKTASIVLSCCFGVPAIAVDTHVHRVVQRLGWLTAKLPMQTEQKLLRLLPKRHWISINTLLVPFGREVCTARSPKCYECPVAQRCPFPRKTTKPVSKH